MRATWHRVHVRAEDVELGDLLLVNGMLHPKGVVAVLPEGEHGVRLVWIPDTGGEPVYTVCWADHLVEILVRDEHVAGPSAR